MPFVRNESTGCFLGNMNIITSLLYTLLLQNTIKKCPIAKKYVIVQPCTVCLSQTNFHIKTTWVFRMAELLLKLVSKLLQRFFLDP